MVNLFSVFKFIVARRVRAIRRWIFIVRLFCLFFVVLRALRVWVERGSMSYFAVI